MFHHMRLLCLDAFIYQWALGVIPLLGCHDLRCNEHPSSGFYVDGCFRFPRVGPQKWHRGAVVYF